MPLWYTFYTIQFEFDPQKSEANLQKHGIDFEQAKELWNDENALAVAARDSSEPRYMLVGEVGGKRWPAIFTERTDKIRIISVRRAREYEKANYISRRA